MLSISAWVIGWSTNCRALNRMDSLITSAVRRTFSKLRIWVTEGNAAVRLPHRRRPVPKLLNTVVMPASLSMFTSLAASSMRAVSRRSRPITPTSSRLELLHQ
ncbi:hypothetical protein D3C78_1216680 [compost metagenome]